ncbi:MAG: helix-hairpin-helix domain-containing protein, partial [Chloroflexi bacterium]|nr:helix-hairpin-helix domain-containing protein [Chloroflexota bacterium]
LAAVIAAVSGAAVVLVRGSSPGTHIEVTLPTATAQVESELKVYVGGAVRTPGVYEMSDGDRLAEAIEAAGGPTVSADLDAVNLAARVKDEDYWYIPTVGEASERPAVAAGDRTGKIDVNSAGLDDLMTLPGIGEVKAQSIVRHRESNGPFDEIEELLTIRGIGQGTLDAIRDLVETR